MGVYLSEKLKEGQLRGLTQALTKKFVQLRELKAKPNEPKARKKAKRSLKGKTRGDGVLLVKKEDL